MESNRHPSAYHPNASPLGETGSQTIPDERHCGHCTLCHCIFTCKLGECYMGLPPTHTQATRAEMFLDSFYEGLYNNKLQFCGTTAVWNKFTVPEKATVEEELGSKTTHPAVSCSSSTSLFRSLLGFGILQFKFRVALRQQRPFRLLDGHLNFHTAPGL